MSISLVLLWRLLLLKFVKKDAQRKTPNDV